MCNGQAFNRLVARRWFLLLLGVAATSVGAGAQDVGGAPQRGGGRLLGRPSPPQPQQQQGVEYFGGSWRFTWTGRESPITAGPRSGTVSFTRIGDSNFLEVRAEGSSDGGGVYKESGVIGWYPDKKILAYNERLAAGVEILSLGDWSSPIAIHFDASPVRVEGKTLRLRRTYSIVSAQSFLVTEDLSMDGGPFVRLGSGDFKKSGSSSGP